MTVAAASLTLAAASSASAVTVVGFQDKYAPSNWTLSNSNANGVVNTTNAPTSISLTGGNNNSGNGGTTDYTITAAAAGTVRFNWNYSTQDLLTSQSCSSLPNNFCDPFSIVLNGIGTILISPSGGNPQSGNYSFNVLTGDSFGFRITTGDNRFGRATVTISSFEAPAASVPEPLTILGTGVVLGAIPVLKKEYAKRNKKKDGSA